MGRTSEHIEGELPASVLAAAAGSAGEHWDDIHRSIETLKEQWYAKMRVLHLDNPVCSKPCPAYTAYSYAIEDVSKILDVYAAEGAAITPLLARLQRAIGEWYSNRPQDPTMTPAGHQYWEAIKETGGSLGSLIDIYLRKYS